MAFLLKDLLLDVKGPLEPYFPIKKPYVLYYSVFSLVERLIRVMHGLYIV